MEDLTRQEQHFKFIASLYKRDQPAISFLGLRVGPTRKKWLISVAALDKTGNVQYKTFANQDWCHADDVV